MTKKDMRRKENKQVLGTATNRDVYEQQKNVVLQSNRQQDRKPAQEKGKH